MWLFFTLRGTGNRPAGAYMLLAVLGFSAVPLLISLGGREAPFLLTASLKAGAIIGASLFLVVFYRPLSFSTRTWAKIGSSLVKAPLRIGGRTIYSPLPILLMAIAYFDHTFFALAVSYIDVAIATVVYETWPIFLIALTALLFRGTKSYTITTFEIYSLSILVFAGFAFVVLSQAYELGLGETTLAQLLTGSVFLIIAPALAPLAAFGLRWGVDLGNSLSGTSNTDDEDRSYQLFGVIMANIICLPAIFVAGRVYFQETIPTNIAVYAVVGGVVFLSVGNIAWRTANLVTHDLGINTISYLTLVLGLIWLFLCSQVGVIRVDYLIIGTAAILTANLLINFEAERLIGFKALVVALWACGTVVYLRGGAWGIWVGGDYFNALALSATVFILILSFRVDSRATRVLDEDNRSFRLVRELDALARRGLISSDTCEYVLTVNQSERAELQKAYTSARPWPFAAPARNTRTS